MGKTYRRDKDEFNVKKARKKSKEKRTTRKAKHVYEEPSNESE